MQQSMHLTQRFAVVIAVFMLGVWGVFPDLFSRGKLFKFDEKDGHIVWLHAIKPGIDISGGTSLVYEIKPIGGATTDDQALMMVNALKKRVDPDGVKNLVWRIMGATQIEIQMPMTGNSELAAKLRRDFSQAQQALEATNIRTPEVRAAAALEDPAQRDERFNKLAMGSARRADLFKQLVEANAKLKAAGEERDALKTVEARDEIAKAEAAIEQTNLPASRLDTEIKLLDDAVAKATKAGKTAEIAKLKASFQAKIQATQEQYDFEARRKAVENYVSTSNDYAAVRSTVSDAEDLKRMLKGSGILEFHILESNPQTVAAMTERLKTEGPTQRQGDEARWVEMDREDELPKYRTAEYGGKHWVLVSTKADEQMIHAPNAKPWGLAGARKDFDPKNNQAVVGFDFDLQGSNLFGDLTGRNIGRPLAIVLDDKLISAPNILSRIDGHGTISGQFSDQDIQYMVNTLNAGSLPAKLNDEPIRERTVGPSLGADNLRKGLISCVLGVLAVLVFMTGYYYLSGFIATVAVIMNLLLNIAILSMFNATFTLPGIAALALTLGMAVDANVLIAERLREEQHRGLSLRLALHNAYERAFSAILDSNVTTVATSMILYFFGSDEIKGFGLTLSIGVTCSMFTALFVTRAVFDLMIEKFGLKHLGSLPLTFPRWDRALRPNVDWMGLAWVFYVGSIIIIVGGLAAFWTQRRNMWDIEFVGGTSVEIQLKNQTPIQGIRDRLADSRYENALPSPSVISVGDSGIDYEVVTANSDSTLVRKTIVEALGDMLNIQLPSHFAGEDLENKDFARALNEVVLPITNKPLPVDFVRDASAEMGGVAVILKDITPPLSATELQDRLDRIRLGDKTMRFNVRVTTDQDKDVRTSSAVVLAYDESIDYEREKTAWQEGLASPVWKLVNSAISQPPQLRRVTTFDPQVADAIKVDASVAVGLSIIFISIYIWIRFANFKFGSAVVAALLHDVLIAIGVIGWSHYLGYGFCRDWLLIDPQRMNLTMIAAILTIMGYSVNDTIIVFDRIRENRGKYGYLSRHIINDSINQTLSRTLLTTGITLSTIVVMYIFGGPAIHGFNYVMLSGILVGTYSSIAIAAPILLWSGKDVRIDEPAEAMSAGAAKQLPAGTGD
jgi:SecD/SecF fusion protein